jgi:hypothetical protein
MVVDPSHSKNLSEIMRDVGRTFPTHLFFVPAYGPGEAILARILKASLRFRPDVGYCQASRARPLNASTMTGDIQGMNFVVAALILARFHDLSPLAASSESADLTVSQAALRTVDTLNFEAESEIFWLFQVRTSSPSLLLFLLLLLLTYSALASLGSSVPFPVGRNPRPGPRPALVSPEMVLARWEDSFSCLDLVAWLPKDEIASISV